MTYGQGGYGTQQTFQPHAADPAEPPASGGAPWSYDEQDEAQSSGYQGGQSERDDEAAYRSWYFLLLAKSRHQGPGNSADWASSSSDDWASTSQDNGDEQGYYSNDADKKSSGRLPPPLFTTNLTTVRAHYHYRCALRCVALRGERYCDSATKRYSYIADYRSPRNATQRNAQP